MAPSKRTMTPEDAAEFPQGNGFVNMQYLDFDLEDDREASDDQKLPAEEDDVSQGDDMIECYLYGTPLLRLTGKHCRGRCYLKQSDGTRTTCVCGQLASACNKHT